MNINRTAIALFFVVVISIGCYVGIRMYGRVAKTPPPPQKRTTHDVRLNTHAKTIVSGVTYTYSHEANAVLTLAAGSISIDNKKIGFFRIGGFKELILQDVQIDFYDSTVPKGLDSDSVFKAKNPGDPAFIEGLNAVFRFAGWNEKKIHGIKILGISIRYSLGNGDITEINAAQMKYAPETERVVVEGNAAVRYKGRILKSNRIAFLVRDSSFYVDKDEPYSLCEEGDCRGGSGLLVSLTLEPYNQSR